MTHEELIQGYFKNTLSENDSLSLKQLLETNSEFKTAFEDYKNINYAFFENEKQDLKSYLKNLDNQSFLSNKKRHQNTWLRYAAASIVVLGLSYALWTNPSEDLYNSYFEIYPNVEQPMVRGSETKNNAFLLYENSNFKEASLEFKSLLQTNSNPNIRFYYAMSLLNYGDFNTAKIELDLLSKINFDYQPESLWYSALVSVKTKKNDTAIKHLEILGNLNSSFKSKERKVLLQKLKD